MKRVYEVADEVGVESGELLGWLRENGFVGVTSHVSAFPEEARGVVERFVAARGSGDIRPGVGVSASGSVEDGQAAFVEESADAEAVVEPPRPSSTVVSSSGASSSGAVSSADGLRWRLVGKATVAVGALRVRKGEVIGGQGLARLPRRVRRFFEPAG